MCLECGYYGDKLVVDMKAKKEARQARLDKKREAMQSMAEAQGSAPEEAPAADTTEAAPAEAETAATEEKEDK